MKKALLTVICTMMFIWIAPSESVHAEEAWQYEYEIFSLKNEASSNVKTTEWSGVLKSDYPVYGFYYEWSQGAYTYTGLRYAAVVPSDDDKDNRRSDVSGTITKTWHSGSVTTESWNFSVPFRTSEDWIDQLKSSNLEGNTSFLQVYDELTVSFPVFSDSAALVRFLESGDQSGWVNKPDVDYSVKHDFSKDVYDPNIPVPELSNLSYNGFSITNIDGYYLDLIVDYSLLGVKLEHMGLGSYMPVVDNDWKYTSHYYNFTLDNRAFSNSLLDINNIYVVDIEHDLIEDFKQWSLEYPKYQDLPTYSFFKGGSATRTAYNMSHVYGTMSYSDLKQLRESRQGLVTYYVRFYDVNGNYGQWMRYTYQSNVEILPDAITIGSVKSDSQGNPIVDNEIKGSQDKESGDLTYNSEYIGIDISDVNNYFSYIRTIFNSISSSLDSFGSLIAACFGFLPQEVVGLIIFGIVLMVFVGIVKAVIS